MLGCLLIETIFQRDAFLKEFKNSKYLGEC